MKYLHNLCVSLDQLANMRERMVYAMLIGDDALIQSIREEYSEVMNG